MALALNNLKRVDMPLNKETKPINLWDIFFHLPETKAKQTAFHLSCNVICAHVQFLCVIIIIYEYTQM